MIHRCRYFKQQTLLLWQDFPI